MSALLENIDAESIVLSPGEFVVYASESTDAFNLLRDNRLNNESLLQLVRAVRRSKTMQEATMELPRGPLGDGTHDLLVRVIPIGADGLICILIFDDSEMRRLDSIRRDFVANISHELKTPIGALSLLSEAVLGSKDDPESVVKFATRMQSEAKRLTDLVQEIINLSRVQDSDPLELAEEVSIDYIIREAIDQCRISADSRKIEVTYLETGETIVLGDRDQLIMAIHNLIENAINYSPENTKVSITKTKSDGIIDISVTDQGIGISDSEQERIFERFYRVDPARSRQTGGTGLGLSIVKHVAAKHGGEVKVWSVENIGSTFSLRLPIYAPQMEITE
jgi:two-component system sensor histidine kinase SenX3